LLSQCGAQEKQGDGERYEAELRGFWDDGWVRGRIRRRGRRRELRVRGAGDERPKRGDLLVAVDGAEMRPAAAEIEAIQAQQFPELAPAESFVT
jgi:hypothetical protein